MSNRLKAYLLLLATAAIWGLASPIIKYTLKYLDPFSFLFWRFLVTNLLLVPLFLFYQNKKSIKLSGKKILNLSLLGFLGTTLTLGLLFVGFRYTTAIDASLIGAVAPIMVVIGGALFLKEEVTKRERAGAFFALSGSLITVIQPVLEGKAFALENLYGNLLVLLSTICWAAYCLWVRRTETEEKSDPFILTSLGFFSGLLTLTPLFLLENWLKGAHYSFPPSSAWPGILYMSIFSSIIAYFIYNLGFSLIEASEATIFDYLKPLFAAPLAVVWLKEKITLPFLAGALLIALGVFLTECRPKNN